VPYEIEKDADACSAEEPWAVKKADGEVVACHASEEQARKHLAAPKANAEDARSRPTAGDLEERTAGALDTDGRKIRGLIPYGVKSVDMGGWREVIEPTAFRDTRLDELRVTIDHRGVPLGRYPKTLELEDRSDGLHWSLDPPKSRHDVVEAIERGDMRAGSWRMRVAKDRWVGDVRHVEAIAELKDVCIAGAEDPAYPAAAIELRTRNNDGAEERQKQDQMAEEANKEGGLQVEARHEKQDEVRTEPEEKSYPAGSLRVEDRTADIKMVSLADAYAQAGFFENRVARIGWDEYRSFTWAAGTVLTDLNPIRREGVPLGYDARWLYPVLPTTAVSDATTSVQYLRQSSRTLAGTAVIRPIDATSTKPETSTAAELATLQLNHVASIQTGIPRIHSKQPLFVSLVEADLRLAVNDGLDEVVRRGMVTAGSAAAVTGDILQKVRRAITVVQSNGYSPDTLAIDPAGAEGLDLLRSSGSEQFYLYGPGQGAPSGPFGMRLRVWKQAGTALLDSSSFGRLYTSPVELRAFEADAGATNKQNVRMELNAGYAVERVSAGLRIL
jgi:phage head maturation protease